MFYVITSTCIDVKDGACQKVCPVQCIYEGGRMMYIQPDECINYDICVGLSRAGNLQAGCRAAQRAVVHCRQCRVLWPGGHRQGEPGNTGATWWLARRGAGAYFPRRNAS